MKKITFLFLFFSICFYGIAQKFYIKPNAGYGWEANKRDMVAISTDYTVYSDSTTWLNSYDRYRFSLFKGKNYGITFGYKTKKNKRFEFDFNYLKGDSSEFQRKENYSFPGYPYHVHESSTMKLFGRMISIAPTILIPISFKDFMIYAKLGGVLGYCSIIRKTELTINNTIPGYYPTESIKTEFRYKSGMSVGVSTALLAEYNLSSKHDKHNLYAFLEIKYSSVQFTPTYGEYTKYTWQGQDKLNSLTPSEKEIEYVDSYTEEKHPDTSKPSKQIKQTFSFSSVGFSLGFRWDIPSKIKKDNQIVE